MSSTQKIIVIGGGLVGCVLARMLALRGHEVHVFEKRPDQRSAPLANGRSTHLVISVRGWKALERIGMKASVLPLTLPLSGRCIHNLDMTTTFLPYGRSGQYIYSIHRSELNRILIEACANTPNLNMLFIHKCIEIDFDNGCVLIEDLGSGKQRRVYADRVFAADGAFSSIRSQLLKLEGFNYSQTYERYGYKELTIPANQSFHLERSSMHAWPRGETSLFAFSNSDGSFTATLISPFDGPMGFSSLRSRSAVNKLFKSLFEDVYSDELVDNFFKHPNSSLVSIKCSPWTFKKRLVLIGDAAHAMVPFLGQGMNAGLEDCTEFEKLLDQYNEDFDLAISDFEILRKRHCDAVTDMSLATFTELTEKISDPGFIMLRDLENHISNLLPDIFTPFYELIAFTHAPYAEIQQRVRDFDVIAQRLMADMEGGSLENYSIERKIHELMKNVGRDLNESKTH